MQHMSSLRLIFGTAILLFTAMFFVSCNDDDDTAQTNFQLEITDAPVDDPQVEAVFVTVAEIRLDGETLEAFDEKQTFDLKAYQNGQTKLLFNGDIDAASYNRVTLILDSEEDASGSSPGTYILLESGENIQIPNDRIELDIQESFEVTEGMDSRFVVDLDLRKAIEHDDSGTEDYNWATESEIEAGLRLVNHIESGTIQGTCTDQLTQSDKIIVYAYTTGSFNMETELQGAHGENFSNAVTSTAVNASGQYKLSFLEAGNYELHFAAYRDLNADARLELTGLLSLNGLLGPPTDNVSVSAGTTVDLNVEVTGLLPL